MPLASVFISLLGDDSRISGLKCKDCHRLFSNRRQIVKHICLKAQYEEEEYEDDDTGNGGKKNIQQRNVKT